MSKELDDRIVTVIGEHYDEMFGKSASGPKSWCYVEEKE